MLSEVSFHLTFDSELKDRFSADMAKRTKARPLKPVEQSKPEEPLDSAVSRIVEVMGSSAGAITLWDPERHQSSRSSSYGLSPEDFERIKPMIDEALPTLESDDTPRQGLVPLEHGGADLRIIGRGGPTRMYALPLRSQGRLVGLLCLFNPPEQAGMLGEKKRGYEIVIDHVDVVYQNARLLSRLMEEKRWLEGVIQSSADAILIVDRDCRIVGFNPAWERLTGWRIDEVRGQPCGQTFEMTPVEGHGRCELTCPMKLVAQNTDTVSNAEVVVRRWDGSEVPAETSYAVIRDEDGRCLGGVISARDITARKEAEALQSTFLSVISHELQTPIAIIKGYADLLSEQDASVDAAQLKQKLGVIKEESERLGKMVENLLSASRLQAGKFEIHREALELVSLVRNVVEKMRSLGTKHVISTRLPRGLPLVFGDYERIHQVVMNLLENALKYSPDGGIVRVTAEATTEEVIVRVRDHGIGVPENEKDSIFRPFSRLDSRMVRQVKGAGLGLYVCKAIVEAHGGRIWVETPRSGGACFAFSLPTQKG